MTGRRQPQPTAELRRIESARRKLDKAQAAVDARRAELDTHIRAAVAAGASLRAIAEVSGLSVEWTRRIAREGANKTNGRKDDGQSA
jgi:hypothetical protein